MSKHKYYTVWVGASTGVFDSWAECQLQTKGYPGASFKAFHSREEAVAAYRNGPEARDLGIFSAIAQHMAQTPAAPKKAASTSVRDFSKIPGIRLDAIAVDGACAGNPGVMEYQAVRVADGATVFARGADGSLIGTNNIAEYLALVHVAAMLARAGDFTTPIYSDSRTARGWFAKGHSNTKLERTPATAKTLDLLDRADAWRAANAVPNPVLKWDTDRWGEIPADFGRKH